MAILSLPASPKIASIEWTLKQPTQANRSEFTGARRVVILATAPRWSAKVKFVQTVGEAGIKALRAFLAALQGQAGRFYLPITEISQAGALGSVVKVDGAGQTGYSLNTKGWVPGKGLSAGDFVTILSTGQPLQLVAAAVADSFGKATLHFAPYLRKVPADGEDVGAFVPYAIMSLTTDETGWSVNPGQIYDVGFDCEEAA